MFWGQPRQVGYRPDGHCGHCGAGPDCFAGGFAPGDAVCLACWRWIRYSGPDAAWGDGMAFPDNRTIIPQRNLPPDLTEIPRMDTFVVEVGPRLIFTNQARVVRAVDDVSTDLAAATNYEVEKASPFLKWIVGDFVEADNANSNTQFWTRDDLALGEYSIKYSPLNMLHKQTTPIGFFLSTRSIDLTGGEKAAGGQGTSKIEALSAMWSHVFPFESALVDQADEMGSLFYSMECRGTHLHCAGPNGCGKQFDYMAVEDHCQHLKERASIRHIVNPTFRGGALIIPPTRPGWKNAQAHVIEDADVREEARRYAELTEQSFNQANATGSDLSPAAWEQLMAQLVSYARPNL